MKESIVITEFAIGVISEPTSLTTVINIIDATINNIVGE